MHQDRVSSSGQSVYLIDGARTPFLKMRGVPGPFAGADLATLSSRNLLMRQSFRPEEFSEVIWGSVLPSASEANIGRVISLRLGCGKGVPALTVQRNCASGLQAIDTAWRNIRLGESSLVLAGGTDSMSHAPLMFDESMVVFLAGLGRARSPGAKLAQIAKFRPAMLKPVIALLKGLKDPVVNMSMGQTAEELFNRYGMTREMIDSYAVESHQRAMRAQQEGRFGEIQPIYDSKGKLYDKDDGLRPDASVEKLGKLKPVFDKHGNITAGNSSQITDGAASVILASDEEASKRGLTPKARIVDIQWAALEPEVMGLGPTHSMAPILKRHNLSWNDIDHIEINEAFAAQVLGCSYAFADEQFCKERLGMDAPGMIPAEKLNPNGGAIALGHPVGASGARLALHAMRELERTGGKRALVSLCIGGGQGGAMLIERV